MRGVCLLTSEQLGLTNLYFKYTHIDQGESELF